MRKSITETISIILITAILVMSNILLIPQNTFAASVPNPSFENTTGWTYISMSRSTDLAHSGSYSSKCSVVGGAAISDYFSVTPNTSYKLSGWIYKVSASGSAYLDLDDIAGEPEPGTSLSGGWVWVSANWFSGSNTSVRIRCLTAAGITEPVYFDDISLVENTPDSTFETEEGWAFDSMSRSRDTAKTGNYSLKSTINGASAQTNIIQVSTNTTYSLSGWIYKTNNNGNAYIDLNDIAGEPQPGVFNGSGGGTWTYVSGIWNSGTNTQIRARCITDGGLNSAAYFDDLKEVLRPARKYAMSKGRYYTRGWNFITAMEQVVHITLNLITPIGPTQEQFIMHRL